VLLQPTPDDLPVTGRNLMARDKRVEVLDHAVGTVSRALRERSPELRGPAAPAGAPA
jgi:hypothetical protein